MSIVPQGGALVVEETLISENWMARVEYLHVDLGTVSDTFTSTLATVGGATLVGGFSSRVADDILRVGVNYKFNWPVIPKYE